ncbi:unnamed protein product, partial [Amoebophrya sp. A25]
LKFRLRERTDVGRRFNIREGRRYKIRIASIIGRTTQDAPYQVLSQHFEEDRELSTSERPNVRNDFSLEICSSRGSDWSCPVSQP